MKIIFALLQILGFFAFSEMALAEGQVACVCQIGLEPSYQRGFFKKGCARWLEEQRDCDSKQIIDESTGKGELPLSSDNLNGFLKLGFVGHWSGTVQSYNYFQETIKPTMEKFRVGVSWDNTACKGLDEPKYFLDLINIERNYAVSIREIDIRSKETEAYMAKKYGSKPRPVKVRELPFWMTAPFTYRAHQVTSIGMWDRYLGGTQAMNFWAVVDVQKNAITLPRCGDFENKLCSGGHQMNQSALCQDTRGEAQSLVCCSEKPHPSMQMRTNTTTIWMPGKTCAAY